MEAPPDRSNTGSGPGDYSHAAGMVRAPTVTPLHRSPSANKTGPHFPILVRPQCVDRKSVNREAALGIAVRPVRFARKFTGGAVPRRAVSARSPAVARAEDPVEVLRRLRGAARRGPVPGHLEPPARPPPTPPPIRWMFYFKPPGARGQALHQDNLCLRVEPGTCVAAWIAREAIDPENGNLEVVPGTHRMDPFCPEKADRKPSFAREYLRRRPARPGPRARPDGAGRSAVLHRQTGARLGAGGSQEVKARISSATALGFSSSMACVASTWATVTFGRSSASAARSRASPLA